MPPRLRSPDLADQGAKQTRGIVSERFRNFHKLRHRNAPSLALVSGDVALMTAESAGDLTLTKTGLAACIEENFAQGAPRFGC